MRHRVIFFSRKENTKKVAESLATGARIACDPLEKHTTVTDVGILFLGSDVRGGKIAGRMRKFANGIDSTQVKLVIPFATAKNPEAAALAIPQLKAILEPKGIKVHDEGFFCKGSGFLSNRGRPNQEDLKNAELYGAKILKEINVR